MSSYLPLCCASEKKQRSNWFHLRLNTGECSGPTVSTTDVRLHVAKDTPQGFVVPQIDSSSMCPVNEEHLLFFTVATVGPYRRNHH